MPRMRRSEDTVSPKASDFKKDPPPECQNCGKDATHRVSIRIEKGFDYSRTAHIAGADYVVCGDCAKTIVKVELNLKIMR